MTVRVAGAPIGGEDRRERAWRGLVADAARGASGGPDLSLAFEVDRRRKLDLDNLVRPAVAGLRDAGVYARGLRGLRCLTATRDGVDGDGGLRITFDVHGPPGEVAWEAGFDTLPPSSATTEWIARWRDEVQRAAGAATEAAPEVFVDIRASGEGRSLVELLKPILDGLEPWLGRDPSGRSRFSPNDHRIRWLRITSSPGGRSLVVRGGFTRPVLLQAIRGELVVLGKEPDGDSIRFRAAEPGRFAALVRGERIAPGPDGTVQLRLEGVDAPETHYGVASQPTAADSRGVPLAAVGFSGVRIGGERVVEATPATVPAVILTKAAELHGRPISYLLVGEAAADVADGEVAVDGALLRRTVNHQLVAGGSAYPLLYTSMAPEHRRVFLKAASEARAAARGVWAHDASASFRLRAHDDVGPAGALVFPKLFRRITDFVRERGPAPGGLTAWLRANGAENDWVYVDGTPRTFADIVAHDGDQVRLAADLVGLVFVER